MKVSEGSYIVTQETPLVVKLEATLAIWGRGFQQQPFGSSVYLSNGLRCAANQHKYIERFVFIFQLDANVMFQVLSNNYIIVCAFLLIQQQVFSQWIIDGFFETATSVLQVRCASKYVLGECRHASTSFNGSLRRRRHGTSVIRYGESTLKFNIMMRTDVFGFFILPIWNPK